jgi:hypothetical protein
MFLAALAHKHSFPVSPFEINSQQIERSWYVSLLSMLDVSDVRQDITEHFGIVGGRITRSFRYRNDFSFEQQQQLIPHSSLSQESRGKDYRTFDIQQDINQKKPKPMYRIVEIEEIEKPEYASNEDLSSNRDPSSSSSSTTPLEERDYLGISVKGASVKDQINYRNPHV